MCRAVVPAAKSWLLMPGKAVRDSRGCDVVLVSTRLDVVRSNVRMVWSSEAEYATVRSRGLKMTACTGAVCESIMERGPLWGVEVDVLRRLEEGMRFWFTAGAASLFVLQRPILPSAEAESIRFDEGSVAIV